MRIRAWLTLRTYTLGWTLVRRLPERAAHRLFSGIAVLISVGGTRGARQLRANLHRVRPQAGPRELNRLTRNGLKSYFRYWCDSFRMLDWSVDRISASVRSVGDGPVREALGRQRSIVVFLGHMGNWDQAGAWVTGELAPITTVAEDLRPPELFAKFLDFRRQLGMTVLPLSGGGAVFRQLLGTVRSGGVVPLLADRDLTGGGSPVTLFGEPARAAIGPAALALHGAAELFVAVLHYERATQRSGRHRLVITWHRVDYADLAAAGRPTKSAIAELTQRCMDVLAAGISEHPEDWHMLQAIFEADLSANTPQH
ncbi:MAG: phosphatidylinositol mannoside acyltransferase [Angustibacter sp.]